MNDLTIKIPISYTTAAQGSHQSTSFSAILQKGKLPNSGLHPQNQMLHNILLRTNERRFLNPIAIESIYPYCNAGSPPP
jgi:hypothetical protein